MRAITILFVLLTSAGVFAESGSYFKDPDVYKGTFVGFLLSGEFELEGVQLGATDASVTAVSFIHILKDGYWHRSVKVTAKMECKLNLKEKPSLSVYELEVFMPGDGSTVLKVSPNYLNSSNSLLPNNKCIN